MKLRRSLSQLAGLQMDPARPAIVVHDLTERFRLYNQRPTGLKERLYRLRRSSYTEFNALEEISFTVEHGESVAVIGHNGSGKSTLLKLLARILPPDEGRVVTNGRVASLLELGAGFHGELTGRENIYLNGAILGLTRAQIDERFDEIVDFAGIRPLLDTAVRTYSSGLYVRLGFAIAVTVDPDILLVDEVLAVGDAEFQARSLQRMQQFLDSGKTVVLVSHDLGAVAEMCDRAILLDRGRVIFDGPVEAGVQVYRDQISSAARAQPDTPDASAPVWISDPFVGVTGGPHTRDFVGGSRATLSVTITAEQPVRTCFVGIVVFDASENPIYQFHTGQQGLGIGPLEAGDSATAEIEFNVPLRSGRYVISATAAGTASDANFRSVGSGVSMQVPRTDPAGAEIDLAAVAEITSGPIHRMARDAESSRPFADS